MYNVHVTSLKEWNFYDISILFIFLFLIIKSNDDINLQTHLKRKKNLFYDNGTR